jgi:predicted nucleic acid-binding protein
MVYLIKKGRIAAESFSRLANVLETVPTILLEIPLDLQIARTLSKIDVAQIPDLPDRVIAATALNLGVPLISRDAKIQLSSINTVW